MLVVVDFPAVEPGAPHAVKVGGDGARVAFLRGSALHVLNVATGVLREVATGPIDSYAIDAQARSAAFSRAGRLVRADLIDGALTTIETDKPVEDPRLAPTGHQIGYLSGGGIYVVGPNGDQLLAGEPGVVWGGPGEPEFGRRRGWWWSPDGRQVLAARSAGAVSLHLLDMWGGWVDVHWDRETYPYLVEVRWAEGGGPLITVLRRTQQHGLVLSVDPRTGETQVHAELADARWVEPVIGTPRYLPDGRVLVGGELAHDGFDARCLFADGSLLTPPTLYVRRVVGVLPRNRASTAAGPDLIVEGTDGDPAEQQVFAIRTSLGGGAAEARRITGKPGWHSAVVGGDVLVLASASLSAETTWSVHRGGALVATLPHSPPAAPAPRPVLERVTDRRLPSAVLYPPAHVTGHKLPVLLDLGAGPGHQQITLAQAGWRDRQWWAAAGFIVVSVDSRGTPGVAPSFEKVVYRRLADVVLADHVDALQALTGKHPDLDLESVSVRGKGLGGWLAAVAVLRRADLFRRGAARDPILDWTTQPTAFAERYLGRLADSPDVYAHHSLLEELPDDRLLVLESDADNARELDFLQEHS
jgi:dipeptidyl-peptidase-4